MKILSVIIPSYNMEAYLPKCLSSLVVDDPQLLQTLDVIVVNDGSKDRTSEIAHAFAAKHPGVFRVVDKHNGHYGSCVNEGLKIAKGEYVKVLDADDYHDKPVFEEYLRFLRDIGVREDKEQIDFVLSDFEKEMPDGHSVGRGHFPFAYDQVVTADMINLRTSALMAHSFAYRLDMLKSVRYRQSEGIPYTDTEWCFHPMMTVRKGLYFPKVVYHYLLGREGQSIALTAWVKNFGAMERILARMIAAYDQHRENNTNNVLYLKRQLCSVVKMMLGFYGTVLPLSKALSGIRTLGQYAKKHRFMINDRSLYSGSDTNIKLLCFCLKYARFPSLSLVIYRARNIVRKIFGLKGSVPL